MPPNLKQIAFDSLPVVPDLVSNDAIPPLTDEYDFGLSELLLDTKQDKITDTTTNVPQECSNSTWDDHSSSQADNIDYKPSDDNIQLSGNDDLQQGKALLVKNDHPSIEGFDPVVPRTDNINDKYFIDFSQQHLGRGRKTIVRKCTQKGSSTRRLAVKSVKRCDTAEYEHMVKEANILNQLDHPNIIKLYDVYQYDYELHMVMELCKGGELYDFVEANINNKSKKQSHQLCACSEPQAAAVVLQVLNAVSYLHNKGVTHRDLKLENILFETKPGKGKKGTIPDIRLIDFGLSKQMGHTNEGSLRKLTSFVGTNYYVAPEVLDRSYTHTCDLWSIGVLAYSLLSAQPPFSGRDDQEIYYNISHCDEKGVEFPSPYWDNVSELAKDFIRSLLQKDPTKRPSADELKQHAWIVTQTNNDGDTPRNNHESSGCKTKKQKPSSILKKAFRFGRSAR